MWLVAEIFPHGEGRSSLLHVSHRLDYHFAGFFCLPPLLHNNMEAEEQQKSSNILCVVACLTLHSL